MQFVVAVVKKKDDSSKTKGELMESNADAMEVSIFPRPFLNFLKFISLSPSAAFNRYSVQAHLCSAESHTNACTSN